MKLSSIFILVSSITLLPLIYCSSDPHNNHDNTWMAFLPSRLEHFLKSRTSTIGVSDEDISSSNQERRTTVPETTEVTTQNSTTPEIASGSTYYSNSNSSGASIGGSIGGIIIFILICYCCFRCCCSNREVVSQGVVVHQPMPQPTNLPNIVIQHVNAGPASPPQQQPIVQHIHNAPPQVHHVHQPPYPPQQNYPPGYEATPQQMLQQEWSPHAPMNQQQPPQQNYPYNPNAPPNYGKY